MKTLKAGVIAMTASLSIQPALGEGSREKDGKFLNQEIDYQTKISKLVDIAVTYWKTDRAAPAPAKAVPLRPIPAEELTTVGPDVIYRLGHSTMLIRLDGQYIMTDPVFSERASPVQWAGPKRFHLPPIEMAALPRLSAIVISHDHYDHLDEAAIKALDANTDLFVTPLKVGNHLRKWGIKDDKIRELDWWQSLEVNGVTLTATPGQHFSGRGLFDKDHTLWAGWAMRGKDSNIFYSGDTGYFNGFKEIGNRLGPFDITMIESGAYNEMWSEIHMLPEQSVQAHIDLKGKAMLPVHNGTFDLALHDWFEPFERIQELAKERGVTMLTPIMGEALSIQEPASIQTAWWKQAIEEDGLVYAGNAAEALNTQN